MDKGESIQTGGEGGKVRGQTGGGIQRGKRILRKKAKFTKNNLIIILVTKFYLNQTMGKCSKLGVKLGGRGRNSGQGEEGKFR